MNNSDKTNLTKRSLIVSILAMTVCIAMLIGTTFAWFTDSASTSVNRIQAGKLRIDLLMDKAKTGNYESIANGRGDIFSETGNGVNWEPERTEIVYLAVQNQGDLALKYNVYIDVTDSGLAGALEYAVIDGAKASDVTVNTWDAFKNLATSTGSLHEGRITAAPNGLLDEIVNGVGDETDYFALAVHMNNAADQYQGKSVTIDVSVVATQAATESDSFGSTYDAEAEYPVMTAEDFISAVNMIGNNGSGIITLGKDITLTDTPVNITGEKNVAVNTNGHTLKSIWTPESASSAFTVDGGSTLSLVGSGTIEAYAKNPDVTWAAGFPGYANNAITNKGTLIVDGATVKVTTDIVGVSGHLGASYCIDSYAGSKLEVKSGNIINSQNIAIRLFTSDASKSVDVTIDGGKIEGTRAIWLQLAGSESSIAPKVNLKINGGEIKTNEAFTNINNYCLALYSYSYGNSFANTNVTINGGDFLGYVAFGGGYKGDRETVTINGGTFTAYGNDGTTIDNDCVGRYTSTEPYWESIAR